MTYADPACFLTEPEITLVLSPITGTTRVDERGAHFIGSPSFSEFFPVIC